jgi:hypothetical protein
MPPESLQTATESAGLSLVPERLPAAQEVLPRPLAKRPALQPRGADYRDLTALKRWRESISGEAPAMGGTDAELRHEPEQKARQHLGHEIASGAGRA